MNQERDLQHLRLTQELLGYFQNEGYDILSTKDSSLYPQPHPLVNDGFGDQEDKTPDILAFDKVKNRYAVGLIITEDEDIESEELLTKYNVFLDQRDHTTGNDYLLVILAPSSRLNDLTRLLTHYIHREYWHRLIIISSGKLS